MGQLWVYLAEFFIRLGQFGTARDVFEEAIDSQAAGSVKTVRDFGVVFNAYIRFEKQLLDIERQVLEGSHEPEMNEFKFFRIESLLERRPFLLSDIVLAQHPNDINEWLKRIKLCSDNVDRKA